MTTIPAETLWSKPKFYNCIISICIPLLVNNISTSIPYPTLGSHVVYGPLTRKQNCLVQTGKFNLYTLLVSLFSSE